MQLALIAQVVEANVLTVSGLGVGRAQLVHHGRVAACHAHEENALVVRLKNPLEVRAQLARGNRSVVQQQQPFAETQPFQDGHWLVVRDERRGKITSLGCQLRLGKGEEQSVAHRCARLFASRFGFVCQSSSILACIVHGHRTTDDLRRTLCTSRAAAESFVLRLRRGCRTKPDMRPCSLTDMQISGRDSYATAPSALRLVADDVVGGGIQSARQASDAGCG